MLVGGADLVHSTHVGGWCWPDVLYACWWVVTWCTCSMKLKFIRVYKVYYEFEFDWSNNLLVCLCSTQIPNDDCVSMQLVLGYLGLLSLVTLAPLSLLLVRGQRFISAYYIYFNISANQRASLVHLELTFSPYLLRYWGYSSGWLAWFSSVRLLVGTCRRADFSHSRFTNLVIYLCFIVFVIVSVKAW